MEERREIKEHNVIITGRCRLEMSGVEDVSAFDEIQIIAKSSDADISIEGDGLKIEKFDCDSGNLVVKGKINGLNYYNSSKEKKKKSIMTLFK